MGNKKKKGVGLRVGLVILLLVVLGFFALIGFITDYLWFKELGYVSVFFKQLFTQLKIGIPTFVLVTLLSYLYFKVLKRSYYKKVESKDLDDSSKSVNLISWGMAGLFGGIVTYFAVTRLWFEALQFAHSVDFEKKDPIFGMDISFYTFKLEFISRVNVILILVLIVFIILTLVYYSILMGARKPQIFEEADQGAGTTGGDPFKRARSCASGLWTASPKRPTSNRTAVPSPWGRRTNESLTIPVSFVLLQGHCGYGGGKPPHRGNKQLDFQ